MRVGAARWIGKSLEMSVGEILRCPAFLVSCSLWTVLLLSYDLSLGVRGYSCDDAADINFKKCQTVLNKHNIKSPIL